MPIALHFALCLGLFQCGLSNAEMKRLQVEGPSRLIEPYQRALAAYGPIGVIRTYLRGEFDERLYLEYTKLLLLGHAELKFIADRQNDPNMNMVLPERVWPYRDVRIEYPPGAFIATLPPALFSLEPGGYRWAFITYMLLLQLLNLWLAAQLLRPTAANDARFAERSLYASLLFMFALGITVVTRLDHLALTAALVSLLAFQKSLRAQGGARLGWAAACGALAAVGVMIKLVPGATALVAAVLWLRSDAPDRYRLVSACFAVGGVCVLASNLGMLALAGEGYLETFRYHTERGVQIESLYSGVIQLLRPFGMAMHIEESFGSTNLASSATAVIRPLSGLLFVASAGFVLWRRRFRSDGEGALVAVCALFLLFMLTNRVFSPQYLIWSGAPMCVLAARDRSHWRLFCLGLVAVWLSGLIFPRGYPVLKALHPLATVLLNLRNGMLIAFTLLLLRNYSTPASLQER